jgi:hypothetical protein
MAMPESSSKTILAMSDVRRRRSGQWLPVADDAVMASAMTFAPGGRFIGFRAG